MALWRRRFPLKDGRTSWTFAYDFIVHGRRYRGSFGKITTTLAKDLYARIRSQALDGRHPVTLSHVPTLRAFMPEFLAWHRSHAAQNSVERYRYSAAWLVQALMGHKTVGMTLRYWTLTDGDLKGVIQVLNRGGAPTISPTLEPGTDGAET